MLAASFTSDLIEAGIDEAGRGCLAGPVVAAAVVLPKDFYHPLLNDSKQLNENQRAILRPIIEQEALTFAVSFMDNHVVDEFNILNATFKAMHDSIDRLMIKPELLLIDGNRFPAYFGIAHKCIVKGDAKFANIAAASILAKTYRDEFMLKADLDYPIYDWKTNKGYPTPKHKMICLEKGLSPLHRLSFSIRPPKLKK
ncbi:MAG TPA: ribonuclease HII [Edaphocola sp.]|nr:ribonuclease HII [Edaphocola sp.]